MSFVRGFSRILDFGFGSANPADEGHPCGRHQGQGTRHFLDSPDEVRLIVMRLDVFMFDDALLSGRNARNSRVCTSINKIDSLISWWHLSLYSILLFWSRYFYV